MSVSNKPPNPWGFVPAAENTKTGMQRCIPRATAACDSSGTRTLRRMADHVAVMEPSNLRSWTWLNLTSLEDWAWGWAFLLGQEGGLGESRMRAWHPRGREGADRMLKDKSLRTQSESHEWGGRARQSAGRSWAGHWLDTSLKLCAFPTSEHRTSLMFRMKRILEHKGIMRFLLNQLRVIKLFLILLSFTYLYLNSLKTGTPCGILLRGFD